MNKVFGTLIQIPSEGRLKPPPIEMSSWETWYVATLLHLCGGCGDSDGGGQKVKATMLGWTGDLSDPHKCSLWFAYLCFAHSEDGTTQLVCSIYRTSVTLAALTSVRQCSDIQQTFRTELDKDLSAFWSFRGICNCCLWSLFQFEGALCACSLTAPRILWHLDDGICSLLKQQQYDFQDL